MKNMYLVERLQQNFRTGKYEVKKQHVLNKGETLEYIEDYFYYRKRVPLSMDMDMAIQEFQKNKKLVVTEPSEFHSYEDKRLRITSLEQVLHPNKKNSKEVL